MKNATPRQERTIAVTPQAISQTRRLVRALVGPRFSFRKFDAVYGTTTGAGGAGFESGTIEEDFSDDDGEKDVKVTWQGQDAAAQVLAENLRLQADYHRDDEDKAGLSGGLVPVCCHLFLQKRSLFPTFLGPGHAHIGEGKAGGDVS